MDFDFFSYQNKRKPEKGRILVSEPFMNDPNFERTVVLLCEHTQDGSFGFVLNKPSQVKVNEVMDDLAVQREAFIGGPVQQDTLHYLHRLSELKDAITIHNNVFWGGDFEELQSALDTYKVNESDIRFFMGYSGWAAGQLEEELKLNSWIVCDYITNELLFSVHPQNMWRQALSNMGGRFSVYANYPTDPNLN